MGKFLQSQARLTIRGTRSVLVQPDARRLPLCQGRHLRHHPVLQHGAQGGGGGGGGEEQRAACSCLPREAAASICSLSSSTGGKEPPLLHRLPLLAPCSRCCPRHLGAPLPSRCCCTFLLYCLSFHSVDSDPSKLTQSATCTALRCRALLGTVHR